MCTNPILFHPELSEMQLQYTDWQDSLFLIFKLLQYEWLWGLAVGGYQEENMFFKVFPILPISPFFLTQGR